MTTTTISDVSDTSAIGGGAIDSNGGKEIIEKGLCWSAEQDPTIEDEVIFAGNGSGSFTESITGLKPSTWYYVRAYAINSVGIGYGNEVAFQTLDSTIVFDIDGNGYPTVVIGNQIWMAKNLEVTKFRNGATIASVTNNNTWELSKSPSYARYNNEGSNAYGLLYNGYTIATNEICPEGWHLPTAAEWSTLIDDAGGTEVAGGKLKEKTNLYWSAPNVGASDEFGFSALPGGLRYLDGTFLNRGEMGYWWAAQDTLSGDLSGMSISYDSEKVNPGGTAANFGLSIRCIKDHLEE